MKLLSIVIPTRNRPTELKSIFDVIQRVAAEEIEFVISDNSDEPLPGDSLSENIRIIRPPQVLSMSENWNFGLRNTTGKYVTFIGDDDLVLPNELDALLKILRTGQHDVVTTQTAGYIWPSKDAPAHFFAEIRRHKHQNYSRKVMRMRFSNLPIPYNNAVFDKSLITLFEKKSSSDKFFQSRIPDVEAGVKLAFLGQSFYHHERIVFVSGTSPSSNGLLHRTQPNNPRALEFTNPALNPTRVNDVSLDVFVPFGYFTFYEAAIRAFSDLGIKTETQDKVVCFRSASLSFEPKLQLEINRVLWPNLMFYSYVGTAWGLFRKINSVTRMFSLFRNLAMATRLALGTSRLVSVSSIGLTDTNVLCLFLQKLERKMYSQRMTIIRNLGSRN